MIMYDQENLDHYKFIVMWFLDIGDDAHDVICGNDDGDETGIINLFFVYYCTYMFIKLKIMICNMFNFFRYL